MKYMKYTTDQNEYAEKKRWYEISDSIHTLLQLRRKEDMGASTSTLDVKKQIVSALDTARYLLQNEQSRIAKDFSLGETDVKD